MFLFFFKIFFLAFLVFLYLLFDSFFCDLLVSFLLHFSKVHGLVACGGEDGALECFDMRARSSVGRINAVAPAGNGDQVVFC